MLLRGLYPEETVKMMQERYRSAMFPLSLYSDIAKKMETFSLPTEKYQEFQRAIKTLTGSVIDEDVLKALAQNKS